MTSSLRFHKNCMLCRCSNLNKMTVLYNGTPMGNHSKSLIAKYLHALLFPSILNVSSSCCCKFSFYSRYSYFLSIVDFYFSAFYIKIDCNFTSFQRQLNLYGFRRIKGTKIGSYFHPLFQKNREDLVENIRRIYSHKSQSIISKSTFSTKRENDIVDQFNPTPSSTQRSMVNRIESHLFEPLTKKRYDSNKSEKVINHTANFAMIRECDSIYWTSLKSSLLFESKPNNCMITNSTSTLDHAKTVVAILSNVTITNSVFQVCSCPVKNLMLI